MAPAVVILLKASTVLFYVIRKRNTFSYLHYFYNGKHIVMLYVYHYCIIIDKIKSAPSSLNRILSCPLSVNEILVFEWWPSYKAGTGKGHVSDEHLSLVNINIFLSMTVTRVDFFFLFPMQLKICQYFLYVKYLITPFFIKPTAMSNAMFRRSPNDVLWHDSKPRCMHGILQKLINHQKVPSNKAPCLSFQVQSQWEMKEQMTQFMAKHKTAKPL